MTETKQIPSPNCENCPLYADACGLINNCHSRSCACLTCVDGSNKSQYCELRYMLTPKKRLKPNMTIKKIIITKPKTDEPFDLGEMLFIDEKGIVTKWKDGKVIIVGKIEQKEVEA